MEGHCLWCVVCGVLCLVCVSLLFLPDVRLGDKYQEMPRSNPRHNAGPIMGNSQVTAGIFVGVKKQLRWLSVRRNVANRFSRALILQGAGSLAR
jgi:hypothetical protein